MQTPSRRTSLLSFAAALTLLLSACTAGEPDLTPLASSDAETVDEETEVVPETPGIEDLPLVAEPPTSEGEAIEWAVRAAYGYGAVENDILNNHPEDTSSLSLIAKGNAVDVIAYNAGQVAQADYVRSGEPYYEALPEKSVVSSEVEVNSAQYGRVEVWGCGGSGDVSLVDSQGNPMEYADVPPSPTGLVAEYDSTDSTWYIVDVLMTPESNYSC